MTLNLTLDLDIYSVCDYDYLMNDDETMVSYCKCVGYKSFMMPIEKTIYDKPLLEYQRRI